MTATLSRLADHNNKEQSPKMSFQTHQSSEQASRKMLALLFLFSVNHATADFTTEEIQFLNELPLDKLLKLKSSLQELVTTGYDNMTIPTTPPMIERFGAQAMAVKAPPIKRGDYEEEIIHKKESKISNIFSMSVTTLAFLAFGGYLLCLIVQAVKAKQQYPPNTPQPTLFLSAGIKKKPQSQFTTYGRRRRDNREKRSLRQIEVPPEEMFSALLQLCEGFAKWSEGNVNTDNF
ncbi:hypothetical protein MSG28_004639 [Choristoneura fumiferana]|uniref:Uncharacterized protein n=1 Tax=Choristoneura fumiferana TaxID=7141 RepID=A0ACC0K6Q6_CHOFU|nr:hypothetical protein MSG28_004639 [Choristoneura fumiferana]